MKLVINLPNDRIEPVAISCINKLYNLTRAGTLDSTSSLVGYINASSAYLDYIDYLRTAWPDLIITATNIYIIFADQEVERVIKTALGKGQDEGVVASELSSFQPNFKNNAVVEYFDEMKYCSPNVTNYAFQNCTNLKSIDLTNITHMSGNGSYFNGCINLEYFHGIDGEKGVLNLTNLNYASFTYWFRDCKKLERITSLGFIGTIGPYAFTGCSALESVTGISSVTIIGRNAFENCSSLSTITIQSITSIDESAFYACSNLEYCGGPDSTRGELYLPNLTGTLGNSAFKGCTKLTSISSLGSITSIRNTTFENCTSLATINFPNTITSVGADAFNNTDWFNSQPDGPVIINDCILYKYKGAAPSTYTIPNSIISISQAAFKDKSTLTSVTIPEGVTVIDELTFLGCSNLTSITIPNSVTEIRTYALMGTHIQNLYLSEYINTLSDFNPITGAEYISVDPNNPKYDSRDNCNAVIETATGRMVVASNNTTIPEGVTIIKNFLFEDSTKASFELPTTITTIKNKAFSGCRNLVSFTIKATTPPILESANFTSANANLVIYVPEASVNAYKAASGWSDFASIIQAIPNT